MNTNYSAFINALKALPEVNKAGIKININGLDYKSANFNTIENAPDYLYFDEYYLRVFFVGMEVQGDVICYTTTFGLTLSSNGNSRRINSYIGYRKMKTDNTMELITESYQIAKGSIRCRRKKQQC